MDSIRAYDQITRVGHSILKRDDSVIRILWHSELTVLALVCRKF